VLSVKANQPVAVGYDEQVDGGHGRIETHRVWSTAALEGVGACEHWPGLSSLVLVESIRPLGAKESAEQRDYSSSLPGTTGNEARRLNRVVRAHWEIENRVHWVFDGAMGKDANHARKGEGAQNLALMRKLVLKLLHQGQSVPPGIAAKQKRARWDHDNLLKILSQT
jgi:predicted transposase YbfD/YdcC